MKLFNKTIAALLIAITALSGQGMATQPAQQATGNSLLTNLIWAYGAYKLFGQPAYNIAREGVTRVNDWIKARAVFENIDHANAAWFKVPANYEHHVYARSFVQNNTPFFYAVEQLVDSQNQEQIKNLEKIALNLLGKMDLDKFYLSDNWQFKVDHYKAQLDIKLGYICDLSYALKILKNRVAKRLIDAGQETKISNDMRIQALDNLISNVETKARHTRNNIVKEERGFLHWIKTKTMGIFWQYN